MRRTLLNLLATCLLLGGFACQSSKPIGAEHPFMPEKNNVGKVVKVNRREQLRRSNYYNSLQFKSSHKVTY
jgi:hypothetical protein